MRFKYFHFIFDTKAEKAHAWLCLTLHRYLDTTYRVDYDSPYPYQTQKVTYFTRCDKHDVFEMHACYIITPKYFACNNVRVRVNSSQFRSFFVFAVVSSDLKNMSVTESTQWVQNLCSWHDNFYFVNSMLWLSNYVCSRWNSHACITTNPSTREAKSRQSRGCTLISEFCALSRSSLKSFFWRRKDLNWNDP